MTDLSTGFHIYRDGNMWCAIGPHFRNLQEDNAGFGGTPEAAYDAWWDANAHRGGFRTGWAKPAFAKFVIHIDNCDVCGAVVDPNADACSACG